MLANTSTITGSAEPLGKWPRFGVLGILLFAFVLDLSERANLVDPIPLAMTFALAAPFFGAGVWFASRTKPPSYMGPIRSTVSKIATPFLFALVGAFFSRAAVEAVAFVGLSPPDVPIEATVLSKSSRWEPSVFVSLGEGTRELEVEVTHDVYDKLEPYRFPGRDCLKLTVQTGRWGIRRTMLPRKLMDAPYGLDRYEECPSEQY